MDSFLFTSDDESEDELMSIDDEHYSDNECVVEENFNNSRSLIGIAQPSYLHNPIQLSNELLKPSSQTPSVIGSTNQLHKSLSKRSNKTSNSSPSLKSPYHSLNSSLNNCTSRSLQQKSSFLSLTSVDEIYSDIECNMSAVEEKINNSRSLIGIAQTSYSPSPIQLSNELLKPLSQTPSVIGSTNQLHKSLCEKSNKTSNSSPSLKSPYHSLNSSLNYCTPGSLQQKSSFLSLPFFDETYSDNERNMSAVEEKLNNSRSLIGIAQSSYSSSPIQLSNELLKSLGQTPSVIGYPNQLHKSLSEKSNKTINSPHQSLNSSLYYCTPRSLKLNSSFLSLPSVDEIYSQNERNMSAVEENFNNSRSLIRIAQPSYSSSPIQLSNELLKPLSPAPNQLRKSLSKISNNSSLSLKSPYHSLNSSLNYCTPRSLKQNSSFLSLPCIKVKTYESKLTQKKLYKDENNFEWAGKISRYIHKVTARDYRIQKKLNSLSVPGKFITKPNMMNFTINSSCRIASTVSYGENFGTQTTQSDINSIIQAGVNPADASGILSLHFKIFVLVMQPSSRSFEIISMEYNSLNSTIADLLNLIPTNCSEQSLGCHTYTGFCRPRKSNLASEVLTDFSMKASGSNRDGTCARILCGEILVAIPEGLTCKECQKISKRILKSPQIVKLLSKAEPLKMRRRRKLIQQDGEIPGIKSLKMSSPTSVCALIENY